MDNPYGVKIKVKAKVIEVEGPRGKLSRNFKHLNLDFQLITDEETGKKKLKVDLYLRHLSIRHKLLCPSSNRSKSRQQQLNNFSTNTYIIPRKFLGEKKVRKVDMLDGVSIVRSEKVKDELVLREFTQ
ncbi:hypothetical protein DH2020_020270 [Rehmannia glutinosa]|uniref:Uncharacterized protein n=1 Tax=Rehmannia glutinosa TaxID=99300 RepID=A0ABR0WIJ1_REHGL